MSEERWVPRSVIGLVVLGLLVRTVELGARIFHWDEGRVGFWIVRFHETGQFAYRPIIHGPFLPIVNNALFDVLGTTDFAARLPVAVVGGLLPLVALALRTRLSDRETVALAAVFAADPLLVYYSRFMRSDVLVGGFAFAAFALAIAAIDRRRGTLFVPAAGLLALGFTAKENALVYVLCFLGAGVLLVDHRLVRTAARTDSGLDALFDAAVSVAHAADRWTLGGRVRAAASRRWGRRVGITVHCAVWVPVVAVVASGVAVGVFAFFYAPRPAIWEAVSGTRPAGPVFDAATRGAVERFAQQWVESSRGNPYPAYFADLGQTLVYGSGVTLALAAIGFLADGYGVGRRASSPGSTAVRADGGSTEDDDSAEESGPTDDAGSAEKSGSAEESESTDDSRLSDDNESGDRSSKLAPDSGAARDPIGSDRVETAGWGGSRPLVAFTVYWAAASLLGYPVATDIQAPWAAIHVVVPLAVPAAVGLTVLVETARSALSAGETVDAALAGLVVLAAAGGVVGANADYWNASTAEDQPVLQWAQPENDLKEVVPIAAQSADEPGTDVLFIGTRRPSNGERLFAVGNESQADQPPPPGGWFDRLPLPWYAESRNLTVESTPIDDRFGRLESSPPPVVIAFPWDREAAAARLSGYETRTYLFRLWGEEVVVFIDRDALGGSEAANTDLDAPTAGVEAPLTGSPALVG